MILINKLNVFNLGLLSRQRTFLMGGCYHNDYIMSYTKIWSKC